MIFIRDNKHIVLYRLNSSNQSKNFSRWNSIYFLSNRKINEVINVAILHWIKIL